MKLTKTFIHQKCDFSLNRFILFIVSSGILFLTGCAQYQYVSIGSNLYNNENKEFVAENDTLIMTYTFKGTDFPVTISLFNKLQQPLYVDLSKSMVIMNNDQISDAFSNGNQVDSVGPQSYTTIISNNLSDKFIPLSPKDQKSDLLIPMTNGDDHVEVHTFNEETSPVFFKSILAVSTKEDLASPLYYEDSFWVSGIFQGIDVKPANSTANQFYIKKTTGFAKFMGYTGAVILLLGLAVISPQQ